MNGGGGRSVDWGLLVLRVFSGLGIAFGHGLGKLPPSDRFIAGTAELGFPMPFVFAWVAALSEFLGGIFIALGIFTRPAAFMVLMTMLVAVFRRHINDPLPAEGEGAPLRHDRARALDCGRRTAGTRSFARGRRA